MEARAGLVRRATPDHLRHIGTGTWPTRLGISVVTSINDSDFRGGLGIFNQPSLNAASTLIINPRTGRPILEGLSLQGAFSKPGWQAVGINAGGQVYHPQSILLDRSKDLLLVTLAGDAVAEIVRGLSEHIKAIDKAQQSATYTAIGVITIFFFVSAEAAVELAREVEEMWPEPPRQRSRLIEILKRVFWSKRAGK